MGLASAPDLGLRIRVSAAARALRGSERVRVACSTFHPCVAVDASNMSYRSISAVPRSTRFVVQLKLKEKPRKKSLQVVSSFACHVIDALTSSRNPLVSVSSRRSRISSMGSTIVFSMNASLPPSSRSHPRRQLSFYTYERASRRVEPIPLADSVTRIVDTAPIERWNTNIMEEEGRTKFLEEIKQMVANIDTGELKLDHTIINAQTEYGAVYNETARALNLPIMIEILCQIDPRCIANP
ncbi:uncharacterized protein LACBIDRAFT_324634 [Laccaria bicolor S238N-H82]|uniref:Predicted protein n=1 Tax=Laccaria bicolor (strain S238N-H82 / ATCC MYA-4686) TaxID=486041 RepID=B0D2J5_LACBS|nr:uncharacterized protein LACBIDRAFT_324634 [Laccaria bicolor S238N-H82]EDR10761.1 predicted protein [Laccaria bicolor S238N-H82]|eukprot:XP_001878062.1 predicted protein [Laccaria bicolor S238N-H82]